MSFTEKLFQSLSSLLGSSFGQVFWYALLAGGVWSCFEFIFQKQLRHRRIGHRDPTREQVLREIVSSLRSILIFGVVTGGVVYVACSGGTRLYLDIDRYGWGWFFLSIGVMIVLHDTYFYWSHRLMHHRWLFKYFHRTHHLSTSPTPWAAYTFSPGEALVHAGIGPLIVFTIPTHPAAFGLFMIWQIAFNVFGHCGYEIFPHWFIRSPFGKLLNSVTHHGLHHEKYRANFGLYFNVWDRLMGTNHPEYEHRFDQLTRPLAPRTRPRSIASSNVVAGEASEEAATEELSLPFC